MQVVAFDQDAETIYAGAASGFGDAQQKKLVERGAAGASDLGQALAFVAQAAREKRVVVVTDGVVTAGAEGAELVEARSRRAASSALDVVLAGGIRDEGTREAARARGLPQAGTVLDARYRRRGRRRSAQPVAIDVAVEIARRGVGLPAHDSERARRRRA